MQTDAIFAKCIRTKHCECVYVCVCVCACFYKIPPLHIDIGVRCSSVVRAFAYGAMGRRIDPSWWTH